MPKWKKSRQKRFNEKNPFWQLLQKYLTIDKAGAKPLKKQGKYYRIICNMFLNKKIEDWIYVVSIPPFELIIQGRP